MKEFILDMEFLFRIKTLHNIFLVILFASGFLFGVQIPNFMDPKLHHA